MVDTVTSQVIEDGFRNTIVRLTNVSDGTGESLITKVDQSLLSANGVGQTPNRLRLDRVEFTTIGHAFELFWGGSPNILLFSGPANFTQHIDFRHLGRGLPQPPLLVAPTGKILLTTLSFASGDAYTIVLYLKKFYASLGN